MSASAAQNKFLHTSTLTELESLLQQASELKFRDPAQVYTIGLQALELARQQGSSSAEARSLNHIAWGLFIASRYEESTEFALQSVLIGQNLQNPEIEGYAINTIAMNFGLLGDYQSARQLYEMQQEIAKKYEIPELYSQSLNNLAILNDLVGGKPEFSVQLLEEALDTVPKEIYSGSSQALIRSNLCHVLLTLGRFEEASQYGEEALRVFLSNQAKYGTFLTLTRLAALHLETGQLEEAERFFIMLPAHASFEDNGLQDFYILKIEAALFEKRGFMQESVETLLKALELTEQSQLQVAQTVTLRKLIELYKQLHDFENAYRYSEKLADVVNTAQHTHLMKRLGILQTIYENRRRASEQALQQIAATQEAEDVPAGEAEMTEAEMDEIKHNILTRLSHEFRTPLAVIQSGTDILERYYDRLTREQSRQHLHKIRYQVSWLTTMLDDILNLLRFTRQERALELRPVSIPKSIQRVLECLDRYNLTASRVIVKLDNTEAPISLDEDILEDILLHLLMNALKYSSDLVHLRVTVKPTELTIQVRDQGIGIPADEQAHILELFIRGTNINEVSGNGLGLAIVDHGLRLHGGSLKINSRLNQGTTVDVTLPHSPTVK
jgi:signal transduction histidine kinase